jgi:molecular chaperone HscB
VDYFEYFGIKSAFQLDLNELRKKYYEKSRTLHPDVQNSNKDEQLFLSAYNNQAYQTLVDPLGRLKYIIETNKGPIQENHSLLSQDFLMDMMDLHEQVNEARMNADSVLIEKFKNELNNLERNTLREADPQIKAFDNGKRSDSVFDGLTVYYFKLKYFKRFKQALEGGSVEL